MPPQPADGGNKPRHGCQLPDGWVDWTAGVQQFERYRCECWLIGAMDIEKCITVNV